MIRYMIANFALLTAFLFLFNLLFKSYLKDKNLYYSLPFKLLIGVVHGGCAILLLLFSYQVNETTYIDFRHIIVISSAYFGGLPASLITVIFVAFGRVTLLGGSTPSTITAIFTITMAGIGSGVIMHFVKHYWRRWLLSLLLSIIIITTASLLRGPTMDAVIYLVLVLTGGLFTASLIAFFSSNNQLSQELEFSERRYRLLHSLQEAIFQSAVSTAITVSDNNGQITHMNKAAEKMLGYQAEELIGRESPLIFHDSYEINAYAEELSRLKNIAVSASDVFLYCAMEEASEGREWSYISKDGFRLTILLNVSPLMLDGETIGFICIATDISGRKKMEERLRQLSLLDGLTEIANRRYFDETLLQEWNKSKREIKRNEMSIILLDIDDFKAYNDAYGHQAGDRCLRKVAATINRTVTYPAYTVARYGGEEFAVILPDTNAYIAEKFAEQLRFAVQNEGILHEGSSVTNVVTISLGVSTCQPNESELPTDLIEQADRALYFSKGYGRNRVTVYDLEFQSS